jgi:hypothetical protein
LGISDLVSLAQNAESAGDAETAAQSYIAALKIAAGYGPAQLGLQRIGKQLFADSIRRRDQGDFEGAVELLVRSLELNPASGEVRAELGRLLATRPERDLTSECLIFPDAARAIGFYGQAIQTAIDFCVYGGIVGDVYEFGVLAGWTAHLFAERMRDTRFYADIHLFDSFSGLPRKKGPVDEASYDVMRGIWQDEMELPDSHVGNLGMAIDAHIKRMLGRIITADRVHVRKGYFNETLMQPLPAKAAIVHLDCDLYQSTIEVLQALRRDDVLQDGTVLMFDDWNCNRANPAFGQRRALNEFLVEGQGRYAVSSYFNYGFNCSAFILHDFSTVPEGLKPKTPSAPVTRVD